MKRMEKWLDKRLQIIEESKECLRRMSVCTILNIMFEKKEMKHGHE